MPNKMSTNQIPPLLPPGVDSQQQSMNNKFSNGNTLTIQGNNIVVGSSGSGNSTNSGNIIRNDSRGPVPLMSQPVSMPNMNLPPPAAVVAAQKQQQSYNNNNNNSNNIDISKFTVSNTTSIKKKNKLIHF